MTQIFHGQKRYKNHGKKLISSFILPGLYVPWITSIAMMTKQCDQQNNAKILSIVLRNQPRTRSFEHYRSGGDGENDGGHTSRLGSTGSTGRGSTTRSNSFNTDSSSHQAGLMYLCLYFAGVSLWLPYKWVLHTTCIRYFHSHACKCFTIRLFLPLKIGYKTMFKTTYYILDSFQLFNHWKV